MSGLVQVLKVATDSHQALVHVIKILQGWNSKVTHYRTGIDVKGVPYLILTWDKGSGKPNIPLVAPMNDAAGIADQIYAWLKTTTQQYGKQPDHDGSNSQGWIATNTGPCVSEEPNPYYDPEYEHSTKLIYDYDSSFYDVICIQPHWIEYHK